MRNDEVSSSDVGKVGDMFKEVGTALDLVATLRNLVDNFNDQLPSIFVVGNQSSGKSSVLEAISGVSLPRGAGKVTTCALELRLRNGTSWNATCKYGQVTSSCSDPKKVGDLVREAQESLCAGNGGQPMDFNLKDTIYLEVTSPEIKAELALVDLPGLISSGDTDTIQTLKDGILEKIRNPNSIILYVVPANLIGKTQESRNLLTEADPDMSRTMGVVTKADLNQEKGSFIEKVGTTTDMKLGVHAVRCRSDEEEGKGVSLDAAKKLETRLFKEDKFKDMPAYCLGIDNLKNKLSQQLLKKIKETFPDLKEKLKTKIQKTKLEIQDKSPLMIADTLTKSVVDYLSTGVNTINGENWFTKFREYSNNFRLQTITEIRDYIGENLKRDQILECIVKDSRGNPHDESIVDYFVEPIFEEEYWDKIKALINEVVNDTFDDLTEIVNSLDVNKDVKKGIHDIIVSQGQRAWDQAEDDAYAMFQCLRYPIDFSDQMRRNYIDEDDSVGGHKDKVTDRKRGKKEVDPKEDLYEEKKVDNKLYALEESEEPSEELNADIDNMRNLVISRIFATNHQVLITVLKTILRITRVELADILGTELSQYSKKLKTCDNLNQTKKDLENSLVKLRAAVTKIESFENKFNPRNC